MRNRRIPPWSAWLVAASLAQASTAAAQALLLLDTAFIHGAAPETRPEAAFPLPDGLPAGWASPVDYAGGTAHFRLEILDKPTGAALRYQPRLARGAARACAAARTLADSGRTRAVYTWSQALSQWTPAGMSWSTRPGRGARRDADGPPSLAARGPAARRSARLGYLYVTEAGEAAVRNAAGRGMDAPSGIRSP